MRHLRIEFMNLGNLISNIKTADSETYIVNIEFVDGTSGEVNLSEFFCTPKGLAAEVVRGRMFSKCFVENGALAWANGLEFCPDALRMLMDQQNKRKSA